MLVPMMKLIYNSYANSQYNRTRSVVATNKIIASIEYPFKRIKGKNFSKRNSKIGANMPIKSEAKGSMITVAEELKNMPVYIS